MKICLLNTFAVNKLVMTSLMSPHHLDQVAFTVEFSSRIKLRYQKALCHDHHYGWYISNEESSTRSTCNIKPPNLSIMDMLLHIARDFENLVSEKPDFIYHGVRYFGMLNRRQQMLSPSCFSLRQAATDMDRWNSHLDGTKKGELVCFSYVDFEVCWPMSASA